MTINLNRATLSLDPLNVAILAKVEEASLAKHANDQPRSYLGASLAGSECAREQQFEWMAGSSFPARVHSIFQRGHHFEHESKQQLIDAGFVFERSLEKLGFVAADGLFAGHADGIILDVPAGVALQVPSLWEHKALNAKNARAVERDGIAKTFPRYAAQVAIYQNFLNVFNPALITITNSDSCERCHFTLPFNARLAQETIDRAVTVIAATRAGELLPRAFDQSCEDWRCKMCSHLDRCRRYE